jgi:SAM-dependent methyltransferase
MTSSLNAVELNQQIRALENEIRDQQKHRLEGIEKVTQEFFDLRLPVASEILDLAAGTGIVSALIQTRGYVNVDALDEDKNVIDKLRALRLYRNYVTKAVNGINSTGLREESYDVIISAGGFAPGGINPNDINEVIRILKEEGVLLWTQHNYYKDTEFGLFDNNLRSLEKEGRCLVLKAERFDDAVTGNEGMFYMIKRSPTKLPDFAMTELPEEFNEQITKIMVDHSTPDNRVRFYDQWSDRYDSDLVLVGNYTGHTKCVDAFLKLGLDRSTYILDLAAGTGLLGAEVTKHGYVMVDAVDASIGMLGQARKQNIYKNYIHATVGDTGSIPVNNESYDVILSSSGFAPGQILPSAFPELLRVMRPGGYLIFTMRDGYQHTSQTFSMLDQSINDLVNDGSAQLIVGPVVFSNFLLEHSGRFYMMRKPAVHHYALASPLNSPKSSPKVGRKQMGQHGLQDKNNYMY